MGLLEFLFGRAAQRRREAELARLNLKFFGYALARQLAAALPVRGNLPPATIALASKPATQADLESDWVAYWAAELKVPVLFHRKLWELAYVLQALHQHDLLREGVRGLGFGCGVEPIASYLASRGVTVTATDQSPAARQAQGWQDTSQHAASREQCYHGHLIERDAFEARVGFEFVDMARIPTHLRGYDFAWSICAFEHLGTIARGLDFIETSLDTVRPGGVSVHTTEFNFSDDQRTIDDWRTVLFQKRHFLELKARLEARGHIMAPLDFDVGDKPLDRFIDLPPYLHDWSPHRRSLWGHDHNHIKMAFRGFACTSFGLIVQKAGG